MLRHTESVSPSRQSVHYSTVLLRLFHDLSNVVCKARFCLTPPADTQKSSTCRTQATSGVHQQRHAWLRLGNGRKFERRDKRGELADAYYAPPPPLRRMIRIRHKA